ncbi:anti-sigma factor family protein [Alsobacter sp. R-9]
MSGRPHEHELHALADGQLPDERRDAVESWLASHPEDAAEVQAWRTQNDALRRAFDGVLAETVPPRLDPTRIARSLSWRTSRRLPLVASIAFLAGVGIGALGLSLALVAHPVQTASEDPSATLAMLSADAYRVFAPEVRHPVEVPRTEEAHLVQWLSKRLGYTLGLPDLAPEGFHLVGGRLLSNAPGAAGLIMFESEDGKRITVYCSRVQGGRDTAFRWREADGIGTFYWVDDQVGFAVSGPLEKDRLLRLSRLIFEAMERHASAPI